MSRAEYNQETETHRQVGLSHSTVTSVEMRGRFFPFVRATFCAHRSIQHLLSRMLRGLHIRQNTLHNQSKTDTVQNNYACPVLHAFTFYTRDQRPGQATCINMLVYIMGVTVDNRKCIHCNLSVRMSNVPFCINTLHFIKDNI
jgi:hypothetical protein